MVLVQLEKGVMVFVAKFCQLKVMIFPRAGKLIKQYESNLIIRILINLFLKKQMFFFVKENFSNFCDKILRFYK